MRRKREPDESSHTSPRSRLGKPTRINLWNVGCRTRVAFRPFSVKGEVSAYLGGGGGQEKGNNQRVDIPRKYSPQSLILLRSRSLRASPG
jgi:hypothetical protein